MHKICMRLCFFLQFPIYVQDFQEIVLFFPMHNICTRFVQDLLLSQMCNNPNAEYMCKICPRLYFFLKCAIDAQDCTAFSNVQYMRKICTRLYFFPQCAIYEEDLQKIVLLSPMCNICTTFVQDYTYFSNVEYMHKICIRLSFFPNAQYMCKICTRLYFFLQCPIYVQDLHKIVLLLAMHNICTGFVQDCTSFSNVQ